MKIGELAMNESAAELTVDNTLSYVVRVRYDAPTNELVVDLLPNASGKIEFIVEVVVPGVFCKGTLYVNVRLEFVSDGTCAVET